jgi:hypothetical protein
LAERDLAASVESGGTSLVVRAVHKRNVEFPDLLTTAHTLFNWRRLQHRREQRGLSRTGLSRDDDAAGRRRHEAEEVRCRSGQRPEGDEVVQRLLAERVAPDGRREHIGDGWDHCGQPGSPSEHATLDDRARSIQTAICGGEQSFDDLTSLRLRGGLGETSQPSASVDVRDGGTLDEDLFDVTTREEWSEYPEVGYRANNTLDHRGRIVERSGLSEVRTALVLVNGGGGGVDHPVALTLGVDALGFDEVEGSAAYLGVGGWDGAHADPPRPTRSECTARQNGPVRTG